MITLPEAPQTVSPASWWLDSPVSSDWPFHNFWAHWVVFGVGIIAGALLLVMSFIWFERRFMGPFQLRMGPNRAGPFGLLQPVADAIKIMMKEDVVPTTADKVVHFIAPILIFFPVLLMFAVIPIQNGVGLIPDLNVGLLFLVAVGSIETIAVFMAGYGSNNKYATIGAMRSVAMMISYEMPMALAVVAVVMVTGTLSLQGIVMAQSVPFALLLPISFIFYFICALAELQRTPFDLLEADSEIVAGYHIEYSGMKFAMFYLGEYAGAIIQSAIIVTLFLGGWKGPILPPFMWFFFKLFGVFSFIVWTRMTWPRVRIDQLMAFAWKYMLPLSLVNLLVVAIETIYWNPVGWWLVPVNIAISVILLTGWAAMFKFGEGQRFALPVGIGLMRGLLVTLKHATRKRITEQYPEQRLTVSKRTRGQELVWDPVACTACTACSLACPHGVIQIKISRGADNKKVVDRFDCDEGLCIFCGLCIDACPSNALFFGRSYERSRYRREEFFVHAADMSSPEKERSAYLKPELEEGLPEQTLLIYRKHKRPF
ncbi:MAG: NADH-quinone oxidoreductase subunit NuoH [Dehalococcoidia bacterium]|nr:NADH-quinone oxidoreductase subunit NuoH [Dehalococcoidia bacterium]